MQHIIFYCLFKVIFYNIIIVNLVKILPLVLQPEAKSANNLNKD